jgi:hypothetical protein
MVLTAFMNSPTFQNHMSNLDLPAERSALLSCSSSENTGRSALIGDLHATLGVITSRASFGCALIHAHARK